MAKEEKLRSEIDDKYKWDLTKMYKDEKSFLNDCDKLINLIDKVKNFKGIITKDANTLLNYMKLEYEIDIIFMEAFYVCC